jgi:hypothetical protein
MREPHRAAVEDARPSAGPRPGRSRVTTTRTARPAQAGSVFSHSCTRLGHFATLPGPWGVDPVRVDAWLTFTGILVAVPGVTSPDLALARIGQFTDTSGLAFAPDSGDKALRFVPQPATLSAATDGVAVT